MGKVRLPVTNTAKIRLTAFSAASAKARRLGYKYGINKNYQLNC